MGLSGVVTAAALQRFSYYSIRSILLIYLTTELRMSDYLAGQVYGVFYGSLFLTSLVGGLLGDTKLGYRFVGSLGLMFILVSHLCLALGTVSGTFVALVLYSVGFGLFDPNMNALVAERYQTNQRLRDSAYVILYIGINLGAMLGPLICGYVAAHISWKYSFLIGGFFSLIGLLLFAETIKEHGQDQVYSYGRVNSIDASEDHPEKGVTARLAKNPITIIGILTLLSITFWAVFDQLGSSVTLLVERYAPRNLGSFEVPASYVQSINPLLVITLGPLVSFVFKQKPCWLKSFRSVETLFSGIMLLGAGFGLLALGSIRLGGIEAQATISWMWILAAIALATLGELLFAPTSTSLVAGLSPKNRRALIMGAWSATFGVGAYLSGTMSGLMSTFTRVSNFFAISAGACWLVSLSFLIVVSATRSHDD